MTIMQRDFLDHLAKLFKAYNVECVCATNNNRIRIEFENEKSMELVAWFGATGFFRDVTTKTDYKPNETELDTE